MRADFRKNRPSGAPGADGDKKGDTKQDESDDSFAF
jgi:hypothetical protein